MEKSPYDEESDDSRWQPQLLVRAALVLWLLVFAFNAVTGRAREQMERLHDWMDDHS